MTINDLARLLGVKADELRRRSVEATVEPIRRALRRSRP